MLKDFSKICVFCCLIFVLTSLNAFAQISGGGNLGTPVAAQLGGLVNSNVFKRLPSSPSKSKSKVTSNKTSSGKTTTVSKTNKGSKTVIKTSEKSAPPVTETDTSILTFNPVSNLGIDRQLALTLSNKPNEQQALIEVFQIAKSAYEIEVAKKGRKNDVAMATAFFIASCLTVYHDAPEPSEAALDNLYNSLADAMSEDAQFAKSSNLDKQATHDRLIYISGLILGGYTKGKQDNDAETVKLFRILAGACLKTLMQIDPDKLSFNKTGLVVKP